MSHEDIFLVVHQLSLFLHFPAWRPTLSHTRASPYAMGVWLYPLGICRQRGMGAGHDAALWCCGCRVWPRVQENTASIIPSTKSALAIVHVSRSTVRYPWHGNGEAIVRARLFCQIECIFFWTTRTSKQSVLGFEKNVIKDANTYSAFRYKKRFERMELH